MGYIWKLTHLNGEEYLKITDDAAEIMDSESNEGIPNRFDLTIIFFEGEIPEKEQVWLEFFEEANVDHYKDNPI